MGVVVFAPTPLFIIGKTALTHTPLICGVMEQTMLSKAR
jgi:hypothetical protein